MNGRRPLSLLIIALIALVYVTPAAAQARADTSGSQMTWAVHVSLAPIWFDPAEHTGIITPMMVLYAVHDALVKPMPGNPMAQIGRASCRERGESIGARGS